MSINKQPNGVDERAAIQSDISCDSAYRNGLIAGFGFGINEDEAGYQRSLACYQSEIHEARAALNAGYSNPEGDPAGSFEKCIQAISDRDEHAKTIDQLRAERDGLANEVGRLSMQLAACGVVAMANTPDSANKARDMNPDYMSASCQDVMRAVDSEIALRAEVEALRNAAICTARGYGYEAALAVEEAIEAAMRAKP